MPSKFHSELDMVPWYWEPFNLFEGVSDFARDNFFRLTEKRKYAKGEYVFMANDLAKKIYYLNSGVVKIFDLSKNGSQTIFWYCTPGDIFGAGGISGSPSQSVYAQVTQTSEVFSISRSNFEMVLKEYPQIAINMIRLIGARLRLACDSMVDMSESNAAVRLARVLLRLGTNYGYVTKAGIEIRIRISHQEIASMMGSSRQTVNSLLHKFSQDGWISMSGRDLILTSPGDLREMVDEKVIG
ncbi:MAG: Crp/Fnr family transcriptional regulator [Polynucleobacter sp.]|jgi:CRP/FNR family cyclic AMP-dependent transcriptional regulator|nr:Crp/Fnr family transcriptional regulator [Polynucleobacter sp.]